MREYLGILSVELKGLGPVTGNPEYCKTLSRRAGHFLDILGHFDENFQTFFFIGLKPLMTRSLEGH
jgi:hypothetical protein